MNLRQYQVDPFSFENDIFIPTGSGVKQFGRVMAKFQRKRFILFNDSLLALTQGLPPPIPRIWDERTKGGSKDTDWSVCLLYLAAFSRIPLRIQIGAVDQSQADEVRQIIKGILRIDQGVNRFLKEILQVKQSHIENMRNGIKIEILTSDKYGAHGARPDVVLIDELTHQNDRGFAETLMDNLDKMPNSLGIIVTNSGHDPSWQLDWKRLFKQDKERWRILEYTGRPPWLSDKAWAEAERRNSSNRFRRLFQGEWTGDTESALDHFDIDCCTTKTDPMNGDEKGFRFIAAVDIGLRKHATGLVVIGRHVGFTEEHEIENVIPDRTRMLAECGLIELPPAEFKTIHEQATNRLQLAYCKAWKPRPGKRVSLESVKAKIIELDRQYNLAAVVIDPAQGEHLIELLIRENVNALRYVQSVPTLQNQAVALIEAFQQRMIDLYSDKDLITDLKRLQLRERGERVRLVSPEISGNGEAGTSHGDLASAMSFAVAAAKDANLILPNRTPHTIIAC